MNSQAIRDLIKRQPFVPFDMTLSSGEVVHVPHPEFVILSKNGMVVGYPDSDRISIVAYLHIASVQTAYPATSA
ncbi:hypothetical protein ETAA8_03260 [Anatilimnocola aggregata]|uniref:Uncharacterized protein n=1 Tax=Anatilimnocola aggregata TaxID=2528021 RepID=A0A517Y560_9BACT|nr:hypothetical protein [Anatilimnocola aggregata]QDU25262.1 hypothetical protein ETAA8_03260 [Anatilimnocola aggregata]